MDTETDIHGWRTQHVSMLQARQALHTISSHDTTSLGGYLAVAALLTIDSVSPEYPPPDPLVGRPSLAHAHELIRQAIEDSADVLEISRLGQASALLALADEEPG